MSRGRRYETEPKLNIKKVIAVIIAILVIIMFVIGIKKLLNTDISINDKVFPVGYYTIYENGKWGVIDTNQKVILEPTYEEMIIIPDNTKPIFICTSNVNYETNTFETKVYNEKKQELYKDYNKVEVIYNNDKSNNLWYEQNILKVQKDGKYGLINLEGKQILACTYDDIKPILGTKNVVITVKEGKQGLVDNIGNVIIENSYNEITSITNKYEDGFIVKSENGKYGVISTSKETVLEAKYDEIKNVYGNNCYVVKENGKQKIVDSKGNTYLEEGFEEVKQINSNNVIIKKSGKYGVVALSGETKIEATYDDLTFAFTDTYIAKKGNKYGIITIQNEEKIPFNYEYIEYVSQADFIRAQKENAETDLYTRDFNIKASGIISEINTEKNYIRIRVGEDYKYYNFKLEQKESSEILTGTLFLSKKDGKYGYVNNKGIVIVDYIYDDATEQNKYGYSAVKKDGKWGAIDQKGKVIVEPKYALENNLVIDFIGEYHLSEDINANYYTK